MESLDRIGIVFLSLWGISFDLVLVLRLDDCYF